MTSGIIRNEKGEVITVSQKRKISSRECDYEEYLLAGQTLLQFDVDCVSELCVYRDGQGGMLASIQGSFHAPVYACDMIELVATIERVGNRSRTIHFDVYKYVERGYDLKTGALKNEVLEEPLLVADGTAVTVMEKF